MGSIRQYIKGNVARDRKRGSVHSEENEEKYDRCSSFLTLMAQTWLGHGVSILMLWVHLFSVYSHAT